MVRPILGLLVALLFVTSLFGLASAQGFLFVDPGGTYSTLIPDQWVFQAHLSTPQLIVFYGEADYDLLYFESLGKTIYESAKELAERSLELFASPGGLDQFQLHEEPEAIYVAGQWGFSCSYSYQDSRGNTLTEYRLFFLLPGQTGFSIAVSGDSSLEVEGSFFEDILIHWRWLF